jgi:hypothetical protein
MNKIKSKPLSYKIFDRITGLQDEIGLNLTIVFYKQILKNHLFVTN